MTLLRLMWSFGVRKGLVKWLWPELERERRVSLGDWPRSWKGQ